MSLLNQQVQQVSPYYPSLSSDLRFMLTLTFVQYAYMTLVCIGSLFVLSRFYYIMYNGGCQSKLSSQLKIHLYAWTCFIAISLLHFGSGVFMWHGEDAHYSTWLVSIKSAGSFAALATAPVSSTFVTLDRIYAMTFYTLGQNARRIYIQTLSICMLFSVFTGVFGVLIWRISNVTTGSRTSCITLTCLVDNNIRDLTWFKFSLGVFNLMLGTVFVCLYYIYGRKLSVRREKKKNFLALLILINEITFNLIPTAVYILFYVNSVLYVSGKFGSIMSVAYCTDGLCTSLIYYFTWYKRFAFQQRSNEIVSIKVNGLVGSKSAPNLRR